MPSGASVRSDLAERQAALLQGREIVDDQDRDQVVGVRQSPAFEHAGRNDAVAAVRADEISSAIAALGIGVQAMHDKTALFGQRQAQLRILPANHGTDAAAAVGGLNHAGRQRQGVAVG